MSHQVLARKWRPGTFSEMVGQQHVLQALVNALESGRLHHAYLFTGTRGVGKTTVARILAKCLNCDTGITATPCGECGACAEIAEGRSVDLIEVDAASKTKVEDTRELLENVQYTPTRSRYKIYLIDEVHMLSNHSFNALLKTLEEPPPHALFLLATTDPQKLPATVLSRCLQFNLKNMQPEQIVAHLEQVLTAESVPSDPEALALIARAAEGSMRDALSLADQAIAYGEGKLAGAQVAEMLGTVDRGKVLDLIAALLDDNAAEVLSLVAHIAEHAPDYVSTLDELSNALHHMTIAQTVPDAMDTSWPDQARIVELAARATLDDTQLFWQMAVSGRREVHLASSARAGLEMILLRMIAFRPAAIIHLPTESGDPPAKKPEPPATPVDSEAPQPSEPAPNPREDTIAAQDAAPEASKVSEADEAGVVDAADALTPERWPEGFDMFHFTGILHNIALNLALIDSRGGGLQFCIKEKDATLLNERHPAQLSQALSQQLGQSVTATITVSDHAGRTPAQYRAALAAARLAEAEQAISSDQALNGLIAAFDGHIIPGSIRPNLADAEVVPLQQDAD
ncbi:MAG: DNA polymerase III subunit gamma/tau [Luminiphilus sp.]